MNDNRHSGWSDAAELLIELLAELVSALFEL